MITLGFGLVHGFGFSFALRETLQFAGSHLLGSLVAFNVGVELGQLFVLALILPALALLFRYGVEQRIGTIVLSVLVAHTAWHWMIDRGEVLGQYPLPELSASLLTMAAGLAGLCPGPGGFGLAGVAFPQSPDPGEFKCGGGYGSPGCGGLIFSGDWSRSKPARPQPITIRLPVMVYIENHKMD